MTRQPKTAEERRCDAMLVIAMIISVVGTITAVAVAHDFGVLMLLAGTAMFVCGCCAYAKSRGRSWALGLFSILAIGFGRGSGHVAGLKDEAEIVGSETARTLIGFAFGFGLTWLITGCGKKRDAIPSAGTIEDRESASDSAMHSEAVQPSQENTSGEHTV